MLIHGMATDTGGRRSVNEDAALAEPPVFIVADGMGGHEHGDVASRTVVAVFADLARRGGDPIHPVDVQAAVAQAAERIRAQVAAPGDTRATVAGTTVSGAILTEHDGEPYWLVLNVGDSRVYRFAAGRLEQVSVDHSLVQELVDAGTIDAAQARRHPRRNVITRAVGTGPLGEVDFWMLRVRPEERLLLCTDGLLGELTEEEVAQVLGGAAHPQEAARELVARAVTGGAADNVTVVVVDAENAPASGATAPVPEDGGGA